MRPVDRGPGDAGPDSDLERRLDAAFTAIRPSPEFRRRLWGLLENSRRPWWRLPTRSGWLSLGGSAAALAAVIITVLLLDPGLIGRPGQMTAPGRSSTQTSADAFGRLPQPVLLDGAGISRPGAAHPAAPSAQAGEPIQFTLAATLPELPQRIPVWRFAVTATESPGSAGQLLLSPPVPGAAYREPLLLLDARPATRPVEGATGDRRSAADAFLNSNGVYPGWEFQYEPAPAGHEDSVLYQRLFRAGTIAAGQIDQLGRRAGALVNLSPQGSVLGASVPVPSLELQHRSYGAKTPAEVRTAIQERSSSDARAVQVRLDSATLVYLAVGETAEFGYFEPAILLTGRQGAGERRILIPALAVSALR